ncbi:MAG: hypothetical protein ABFR89_02260 [Actinomycetota bacterium]
MLANGPWRSPRVTVATTFRDRFVGMRRGRAEALLLRASSIHGVGLREPLRIVHLGLDGTVIRQDVLTPGRRLTACGPWILELPIGASGPANGAILTVLPSSAP